jgi:hypothetical protein
MEHDGMGDGSGIYEEPCFYCKQFNPSPNEEEACISNSNLAAQMTSARLEIARQQREITRMLTALDELTAENKKLKLDLAAAEHYTTDDLTSPARLCVKCRCPWPCEFTSVPAQGYGRTGGGPAFQSWLDESFEKSHGRLLDDTFPA